MFIINPLRMMRGFDYAVVKFCWSSHQVCEKNYINDVGRAGVGETERDGGSWYRGQRPENGGK